MKQPGNRFNEDIHNIYLKLFRLFWGMLDFPVSKKRAGNPAYSAICSLLRRAVNSR